MRKHPHAAGHAFDHLAPESGTRLAGSASDVPGRCEAPANSQTCPVKPFVLSTSEVRGLRRRANVPATGSLVFCRSPGAASDQKRGCVPSASWPSATGERWSAVVAAAELPWRFSGCLGFRQTSHPSVTAPSLASGWRTFTCNVRINGSTVPEQPLQGLTAQPLAGLQRARVAVHCPSRQVPAAGPRPRSRGAVSKQRHTQYQPKACSMGKSPLAQRGYTVICRACSIHCWGMLL